MATRFLEVKDLHGWYGESHVLHGVNFHVDEGEVVTLLGRNGAGRTSTLRAIMGLIGSRKGSIKVKGLHAWYGESHVLHGVDFHVDEGEVVTLLGRNGAGRTSTLRAIMGLIGSRTGSIKIKEIGRAHV